MKTYLVEIGYMKPYPKQAQYRESGSGFPQAIAKALRKFRKEQKGLRIQTATIKFIQL